MIEAIIFDKDGTLFGFQETWGVLGERLSEELSGGDHALAQQILDAVGFEPGSGFRQDSIMIAGSTADVVAALKPLLPEGVNILGTLNRLGAKVEQKPVAGLVPTLETLAARYRMGVVTNDTEGPAQTHLAQAGIARFFAFVAGYDSGFGQKPEPGQLLAFCETVGVPPDETLMVGDSRHDLVAAQRAGMPAVGVLSGVAQADELAPFCEAVLPSIAELPKWLDARMS